MTHYSKVDDCLENELSAPMYIVTDVHGVSAHEEIHTFVYKFKVNKNKWPAHHHPFLAVLASPHTDLSMELAIHDNGEYGNVEVYVAIVILLFLYVMIASEMIHRTAAAFVCALMAIAALTILKGHGPTMEQLVEWIDWETLLLLFGMMIMVAIFAESGFFDYAAVVCCKIAGGKKWTLIFVLCLVSAVISAFLDNVTTVLLMTPVTIKICEALNFKPVPILIAIVVSSNIGGAATAIGDPPNVLIVSNKEMQDHGVNFMVFTTHLAGGAAFCFVIGFLAIFLLYRKMGLCNTTDPETQRLLQTINLWTRYANRIPSVTREENLIKVMIKKEVQKLKKTVNEQKKSKSKTSSKTAAPEHDWRLELRKLEETSKIKDHALLAKASLTLAGVVIMFFTQSTPFVYAPLGTIALAGAVLLMILSNEEDIEHIFEKVEWTTLVFFGSLFILMEALTELHLLDFIGDHTINIISSFDESIRLPIALVLILWVSAISSAFIDNIPFTQAMIPVVLQLGDSDPTLPLLPLVWALALGACLGGNGTLIGASANLVCAATAQQKGYRISFVDFFKIGFPVMLSTIVGATIYLYFCHVLFEWHEH